MIKNEYMTPQEVAEKLRVTLTSIYNWIGDGRLKAAKVGDLWRIRPDDLESFLQRKS